MCGQVVFGVWVSCMWVVVCGKLCVMVCVCVCVCEGCVCVCVFVSCVCVCVFVWASGV